MRLPSAFNVGVLNHMRLLRRHVRRGSRFLEIGCAPGKMLAWVAAVLGARVSGLDYSTVGLRHAKALFSALGLDADLRAESIFDTTFEPKSFDFVFSAGVVEHFDDPRDITGRHVALLRPGGTAIITVPNLSGFYGRLLRLHDPALLALHNVSIMTPQAMLALVPEVPGLSAQSYYAGRFSPSLIVWNRFLPGSLASLANAFGNVVGLLQPLDIRALQPMVVLVITKNRTEHEGS